MTSRFKPRILVLPIAALVIAGLVVYKSNQTVQRSTSEARDALMQRRPAPTFKLHDHHSRPFRLDRYLGRHKLVVVFFDPSRGIADNPQLQVLQNGFDALTARGEKVLAISFATPYANREALKGRSEPHYHLLSDADFSVETQWGCIVPGDPPQVIPSVFVVDRAGVISWSQIGGKAPVPLDTLLRELHAAR